MDNLYLSFSVVFPLVFMMGLGYILSLFKVFDEIFFVKMNSMIFGFFLPILIFIGIYQSDFNLSSTVPLVIYAIVCTCFIVLCLLKIVPKIIKVKEDCSVVIQGIYRSNFVLFGIPITASLHDNNISITSILVAFIIPLYNLLAVIILQDSTKQKTDYYKIIKEIIKNPLIIGSVLGFIFVGFQIKIPHLIYNTFLEISQVATPLALIALGGSFQIRGLKKFKRSLMIAIAGKLVIIPIIFISLSVLLGYRGLELTAFMVLFSTPTAIASYTMAQSMKANGELAGQIVVLTSILSILTIFICVSILQFANLV